MKQEQRGYLQLAAKGPMRDEELDEALARLEEARITAEREVGAIRDLKKALEKRDHDALLESYAEIPSTLSCPSSAVTSTRCYDAH